MTDGWPIPLWLVLLWQAVVVLAGLAVWRFAGYQVGYREGREDARLDVLDLLSQRLDSRRMRDVRQTLGLPWPK